MKPVIYTTKVEDLSLVAKNIIDTLSDAHKGTASVIFLNGDLGAGKTTFSQDVAKYLGVEDKVVSPTFILKKEYRTTHEHFKKLIHIDAYRFNDPKEARVLRLEDDLEISSNVIIIEWPDKIPPVKNDVTVSFEVVDEETRDVKIEYED